MSPLLQVLLPLPTPGTHYYLTFLVVILKTSKFKTKSNAVFAAVLSIKGVSLAKDTGLYKMESFIPDCSNGLVRSITIYLIRI